jgi:nitroreductase
MFLSGALAATGLTATGLAGCSRPAQREDFPAEESLGSLSGRLDPVSCELLYLASLAPSAHNSQPWEIRVASPDRWYVALAPSRRLPVVDPADREAKLSVGAFVENLKQAGDYYGRPVELAAIGDETEQGLAVLFVGSSDARAVDLNALRRRRTLHAAFAPRRLRRGHVDELLRGVGDARYFPPGSPEARWLDEATYEANRAQTERQPAMEELARWIAWSDSEARDRRLGLTPASMEIDGLAGWWTRHFYDPDDVVTERFRQRTLARVRDKLAGSGGWIAVWSEDGSSEALLDAGRRCERLWLRARVLDVGVHPMSQALEEPPWREDIANLLDTGPVQFLLRVGYAASYPEPVSLRLPLNGFVTVSRGSDA